MRDGRGTRHTPNHHTVVVVVVVVVVVRSTFLPSVCLSLCVVKVIFTMVVRQDKLRLRVLRYARSPGATISTRC